ncbi:MAG: penicillin-binding protein 2 [Chloroflexi bacterium]|nr:penicillin-binding protein 2 [Chloroflexota bacterium]
MIPERDPDRRDTPGAPSIGSALLRVGLSLALIFGGLSIGLGYWQVVEAQSLTADPGNPLVQAAVRAAPRGRILDRTGVRVALDEGSGADRRRRYPYQAMAPVVGYKSLIFGAAGVERAYDAELTGLAPLGPGGDVLRKFLSDPYDPSDVHLTVDLRLQQAAMAALAGNRGAVVAIEPATGRVLAMASAPSFDPDVVADPTAGPDYVAGLRDDRDAPFLDRAGQGLYVPGSVFKIVTATAGLGSGAIRPETSYPAQPEEYRTGFRVEGFTINDSERFVQLDHPLDLIEATEVSSNIYYAHAGLDIGAEAMLDWSRRLGFGAPIEFDLATSASQVTDGSGPLSGFTDRVELANAAYGQGETLATPLQMALVAACVANDGQMMQPRLVRQLVSESGDTLELQPAVLRQVIDPAGADIINRAMVAAVEGEFGEFFAGGARVPGVTTAGKSGSAQVGDSARPHSWFIGFAPAEQPRIAIAAIVERAGFGSEVAVPLAGDLMQLYLGLPEG